MTATTGIVIAVLTNDSSLARKRDPGARVLPQAMEEIVSSGFTVNDAGLFLTKTNDVLSIMSCSPCVLIVSSVFPFWSIGTADRASERYGGGCHDCWLSKGGTPPRFEGTLCFAGPLAVLAI